MSRRAFLSGVVPWSGVVLGAALALGCAAADGPPAAAPRRPLPPELPLPDGLDLAVRVDVAALSAELGPEPTRQFLLDALRLGDSARADALLARSLERAALVWYGLPAPGASPTPSSVLLLRGHFAELGQDPGWSKTDAGLAQLELAPAGGDGYARVYRLPGDEQLLWAPGAELPRVERALAGELAEAVLAPPERGAVSLAARPEGVLERARARYPGLAERFQGMTRIEAFAEPTAGMWRADLELEFASADRAAEASEVIERLRETLGQRGCAVGVVARALAVTRFEGEVRVQTVLVGPELDALKACVLGDGCCA